MTQPVSEESEEFPTEKVQSVETTLEKPATDESEVAPTMDATTVETTAVEEVVVILSQLKNMRRLKRALQEPS